MDPGRGGGSHRHSGMYCTLAPDFRSASAAQGLLRDGSAPIGCRSSFIALDDSHLAAYALPGHPAEETERL